MKTLNVGILAHVDAGKTSLTERLLFEAGVIDHIGSVDKGTTQTDSLELERQRGITIQSAVVAFTIDDLKINLIDTPGHSDFISEVERALRVLDGAVLIISAVEGVQAQTRILARTLTKLDIPFLIYVNKIDRAGAQYHELLEIIHDKITPHGIAMSSVTNLGTPDARISRRSAAQPDFSGQLAELLTEHNESFLNSYLDDSNPLCGQDYWDELVLQSKKSLVHPVFFGSAITGEGIGHLIEGITQLLPSNDTTGDRPLRATTFKIERGQSGEKTAYVRIHSGTLSSKNHVDFYRNEVGGSIIKLNGKVTGVRVFDRGATAVERSATPVSIAKISGMKDIQIGDQLGSPDALSDQGVFAPPSLETVVRPTNPQQKSALFAALQRLAEQDPLINARKDDTTQTISILLYGEVQKEVIKTTLADAFGIDVMFEETQALYVEKPIGVGSALEEINQDERNYFWATVGLRIEPGPANSGITFGLAVELGSLPLAFHKAIEESVYSTLQQGIYGWNVLDCVVTLTHSGYFSPVSAAGDFRKATPLVVMEALKQAGTKVYEPINRFELEIPSANLSAVLLKLADVRAVPEQSALQGSICSLEGTIPASKVYKFEQHLPKLTQGEGVLFTEFQEYRPFNGPAPARKRTDDNPANRKEYLLRTLKRI